MKKKWIIILIFIAFVIAFAVMFFYFDSAKNDEPTIDIPKDAIIYTDDESFAMLKDEKQYAMTNLILQEVYLAGEVLNVYFCFEENVDKNQIEKARSFVITRFVLRSGEGAFLGTGPYIDIIKDKDIIWNFVNCWIYSGDELVYYEVYNEKGQVIN